MARFHLNLQIERVWQRDYANHAEATIDIADYIVSFYNNVRMHSKLGNLPPNAFEQSAIRPSQRVRNDSTRTGISNLPNKTLAYTHC